MTVFTVLDSPIGELLLVGEETPAGTTELAAVSVPGQKRGAAVQPGWTRDDAAFAELAGQLRAYFRGEPVAKFAYSPAPAGTDFQRQVWAALESVPAGSTATYGELADAAGLPRSSVRAVGAAVGANPLLVVRPCHRVIGADGSLTGYAGGLERKKYLLELEGTAA